MISTTDLHIKENSIMTISKIQIKLKIQKSKTYKKRASRTTPVANIATTLLPGDKFKYKGYSCKTIRVTNGLVYFDGKRKEDTRTRKGMVLNVESFNAAYAERRIILIRSQSEPENELEGNIA